MSKERIEPRDDSLEAMESAKASGVRVEKPEKENYGTEEAVWIDESGVSELREFLGDVDMNPEDYSKKSIEVLQMVERFGSAEQLKKLMGVMLGEKSDEERVMVEEAIMKCGFGADYEKNRAMLLGAGITEDKIKELEIVGERFDRKMKQVVTGKGFKEKDELEGDPILVKVWIAFFRVGIKKDSPSEWLNEQFEKRMIGHRLRECNIPVRKPYNPSMMSPDMAKEAIDIVVFGKPPSPIKEE